MRRCSGYGHQVGAASRGLTIGRREDPDDVGAGECGHQADARSDAGRDPADNSGGGQADHDGRIERGWQARRRGPRRWRRGPTRPMPRSRRRRWPAPSTRPASRGTRRRRRQRPVTGPSRSTRRPDWLSSPSAANPAATAPTICAASRGRRLEAGVRRTAASVTAAAGLVSASPDVCSVEWSAASQVTKADDERRRRRRQRSHPERGARGRTKT